MSIVLASGSPRRKELLEMLGVNDLKIIPAKGEESAPEGLAPGELVMALAAQKGREVKELCKAEDVIIAADTIVWHENQVYGKPHSRKHAIEMLRSLQGRAHQVYTGVCLICGDNELLRYNMSQVRFRPMSDEEIEAYVATGEPMDKAGAYGAQGKGAIFVEGIEGDFFNVMGLPLCTLGEMLKTQGVKVL
ncbi:MAG: septum formation inhibitor Maf [Oscillospiraceae bacterium]|nr:septum formation inhibitor Maf [Oscillospiraceae bacterium]